MSQSKEVNALGLICTVVVGIYAAIVAIACVEEVASAIKK